jgi:hypothetical protein
VFLEGTAVPGVPVNIDGQIVLANNGCAPYGGTVSISDYTSGTAVSLGPPVTANQQYCDSFIFPTVFKTAGQHLIRVSFTGDSNVNASTSTGNITVNANTSPFINFSADVPNTVVGGVVNLSAQVQSDVRQYIATGSVVFLDGNTTIGTAKLDGTGTANLAISTLAAGTHILSAGYAGDAVLTSATGGPITEMVADYTMQAQPTSLTVSGSQAGSAMISVIPLGGSTQTVSFSCGNVPAKLTCAFAPASVTLDGVNAGSVKLTVSSGVVSARDLPKSNMWGVGSTMAVAVLFLPIVRRKHLKHLFGTLAILAAFSLFAVGCGSSNSTPAAQKTATVVLNVTASVGAVSVAKTLPIVITVNQ